MAFIKENIENNNFFYVWKHYYCLRSSPDVKRMIIILYGGFYICNIIIIMSHAKSGFASSSDGFCTKLGL